MINEYENTLRRIILMIFGEDTSLYKVSPERIAKWEEKKETEFKKNKDILFEKRLLYYSDFYDLKTIIIKNWEKFLPILHDKKRFETFFEELERFRNTVAHGRNLTLSQENLLTGITLDLKNLITIYHNKNEMKEDFFIRLIKVTDNLGNSWESGKPSPSPTLRVGDEYELIVEAHDPKGRQISYEIFLLSSFKMKQLSNRLSFTITNDMVDQSTIFYLNVSTPDSEYNNKDGILIRITILPQ